jgi:hypothetical protein
MARQSAILIPSSTIAGSTGSSDWIISTNGATTGSTITLGKNQMFVINSTQDISISFGNATGTMVAPGATAGYRIPANQQTTFDMGQNNDSFIIYNNSASTTSTTYVKILAVS